MKQIFRCTLTFLEPRYASTRPSNIFLKAEDADKARSDAESVFKTVLGQRGIPDAKFSTEVRRSSDDEVEQYVKDLQSGSISGMVN